MSSGNGCWYIGWNAIGNIEELFYRNTFSTLMLKVLKNFSGLTYFNRVFYWFIISWK
jgi:hypothetical protein